MKDLWSKPKVPSAKNRDTKVNGPELALAPEKKASVEGLGGSMIVGLPAIAVTWTSGEEKPHGSRPQASSREASGTSIGTLFLVMYSFNITILSSFHFDRAEL